VQGATGNQGVVGQVDHWNAYKDFNFDARETRLSVGDKQKVNEIAEYMKENRSLQIGIDGTAVRSSDQVVNNIRVNAIRTALIDAGVSPDRIRLGAIGNRDLQRQGRIPVLFTTMSVSRGI
jgi:outer membrane protein OmpA-like peptidoglycan-associated protein